MNSGEVDRIARSIDKLTNSVNKLTEEIQKNHGNKDDNTIQIKSYHGIYKGCAEKFINGIKIVSWADGNYDEIKAMLKAHYDGIINIGDYWKAGDTRIEYMETIPEDEHGIFEHHSGHDIELVIVGVCVDELAYGNGIHAAITVMVKGGLSTLGIMDSGASHTEFGWENSKRRNWLNNNFRDAIPIEITSLIRPIIKYNLSAPNVDNIFLLSVNGLSMVYDYSAPNVENIFLLSVNELSMVYDCRSHLDTTDYLATFQDTWTRDFGISSNGFRYVKSINSQDIPCNWHWSRSLPDEQKNIVPMFCL